jgi:hypothetical protein
MREYYTESFVVDGHRVGEVHYDAFYKQPKLVLKRDGELIKEVYFTSLAVETLKHMANKWVRGNLDHEDI